MLKSNVLHKLSNGRYGVKKVPKAQLGHSTSENNWYAPFNSVAAYNEYHKTDYGSEGPQTSTDNDYPYIHISEESLQNFAESDAYKNYINKQKEINQKINQNKETSINLDLPHHITATDNTYVSTPLDITDPDLYQEPTLEEKQIEAYYSKDRIVQGKQKGPGETEPGYISVPPNAQWLFSARPGYKGFTKKGSNGEVLLPTAAFHDFVRPTQTLTEFIPAGYFMNSAARWKYMWPELLKKENRNAGTIGMAALDLLPWAYVGSKGIQNMYSPYSSNKLGVTPNQNLKNIGPTKQYQISPIQAKQHLQNYPIKLSHHESNLISPTTVRYGINSTNNLNKKLIDGGILNSKYIEQPINTQTHITIGRKPSSNIFGIGSEPVTMPYSDFLDTFYKTMGTHMNSWITKPGQYTKRSIGLNQGTPHANISLGLRNSFKKQLYASHQNSLFHGNRQMIDDFVESLPTEVFDDVATNMLKPPIKVNVNDPKSIMHAINADNFRRIENIQITPGAFGRTGSSSPTTIQVGLNNMNFKTKKIHIHNDNGAILFTYDNNTNTLSNFDIAFRQGIKPGEKGPLMKAFQTIGDALPSGSVIDAGSLSPDSWALLFGRAARNSGVWKDWVPVLQQDPSGRASTTVLNNLPNEFLSKSNQNLLRQFTDEFHLHQSTLKDLTNPNQIERVTKLMNESADGMVTQMNLMIDKVNNATPQKLKRLGLDYLGEGPLPYAKIVEAVDGKVYPTTPDIFLLKIPGSAKAIAVPISLIGGYDTLKDLDLEMLKVN